ncbi:unnamed protein product, partial [marine sediment metagenome]
EVTDSAKNCRVILRCIIAVELYRLVASQTGGFVDFAIVNATII